MLAALGGDETSSGRSWLKSELGNKYLFEGNGYGDGVRKRVGIGWALAERGKQGRPLGILSVLLWTFRSFAFRSGAITPPLGSRSSSPIGRLLLCKLSTDTAFLLTFELVIEQIQCLLIGFGRTLNREHSLASVIVRALGDADLAAAQTTDLGNLRPRAPDNAADHVRRDRDVLRANLPAIGRGCSICGGSRSGGRGRSDGHSWRGDDGDKRGVRRDGREGGCSGRAESCRCVGRAAVNGAEIGEGDTAGNIDDSSRKAGGVIVRCCGGCATAV